MAGGRPPKFTVKAREKILQAVGVGATMELAAIAGGVNVATLRRWLHRGARQNRGEYADFFAAFCESHSNVMVRWLAVIEAAAKAGDWKAAAFKLKACHPEYGASRLEVTGRDGGPVQQVTKGLTKHVVTSPEDQAEILEILKEAGALDQVFPELKKTGEDPEAKPDDETSE